MLDKGKTFEFIAFIESKRKIEDSESTIKKA
jgi:hypothetical protein